MPSSISSETPWAVIAFSSRRTSVTMFAATRWSASSSGVLSFGDSDCFVSIFELAYDAFNSGLVPRVRDVLLGEEHHAVDEILDGLFPRRRRGRHVEESRQDRRRVDGNLRQPDLADDLRDVDLRALPDGDRDAGGIVLADHLER